MVALVFDASRTEAPAHDHQIRLTFGRSRSEVRWQDRREMTFAEMADVLSAAPVGGKDGTCYTPAIFTGQARRMEQAARIDVAVLDADCGHSLEEICVALRAKGWRAIVHSTYSHLSDQSVVSAGAAEKWLGDNPGQDIAAYMRAKKGYLPRVVAGARVVDETRDGNARNLIVQHNPCPKFRIVLPLAEAWVAEEFETQTLANAKWRERIGSLAHALGLHHDQSCVDTSRLFYLPRRRDAEQPFEHVVLDGGACPIWSLPDAAAATESNLFNATAAAPAAAPRLQVVNADHKTWTSPDGEWVDLTAWAAKYALRFEVVTALRVKAPGVFSSRRSGVKHHLICPNAGDHYSSGAEGTGTYAVNASQVAMAGLPSITSGFVINCMHNGCAGHDRLDHVRGLLANGSLAISDLTCDAFLTPDIPQVDPSALIRSEAKKPPAAPQGDQAAGQQGQGGGPAPQGAGTNNQNNDQAAPQGPAAPTEAARQAPAPVPADNLCTDQSLSVVLYTDKATYKVGDQPVFTIAVTNGGLTECVRDIGKSAQNVVVRSLDGTRTLWSARDCSPLRTVKNVTFAPGQQERDTITWSGTTSTPPIDESSTSSL